MRTFSARFRRTKGGLALAVVLSVALMMSLLPGAAFGVPEEDMPSFEPDAYEVDNIQSMAKWITVGAAPQKRTIHDPMDRDWVKFTAKAGDYYQIDTGLSSLRPTLDFMAPVYVEVYDASGDLLDTTFSYDFRSRSKVAAAEGDEFTLGKTSISPFGLTFQAPSAGTFYLRVAVFPYYYYPVTDYTLEITSIKPNITGTVTDPEGEPLGGVWVYAEPADYGDRALATVDLASMPIGMAITDANGRYVLNGLPEGDYRVYFESNDWETYRSEYYDDTTESYEATPVRVAGPLALTSGIDAVLDYRVAEFSGRVMGDDGEPAEDVKVDLYRYYEYGGYYSYYSSVYTDESGEWRYVDASDGQYKFFLQDNTSGSSRYQSEWFEDASDVNSATSFDCYQGSSYSIDATLSMLPVAVRGVVSNEDGEPVYDAYVQIFDLSQNQVGTAWTGVDGSWTWSSGSETSQTVRVWVDPYDYMQEFMPEWYDDAADWADATDVEAGTQSPPTLLTTLDRAAPSVSGIVTDQVTGEPIEGIEVWLYVDFDSFMIPFESVLTDADGYYEFRVPEESPATLRFFDQGGVYAQEFWDEAGSLAGAESFWMYPHSDVVIDEELEAREGRVYDADRFGTATAIVEQQYPDFEGIQTLVIASGDDRAAADPLSAASLCWAFDAPMLLTSARGIPESTMDALEAIEEVNGGIEVLVVGGPVSVPESQLDAIEDIFGEGSTHRLPYGDRFETARQVALITHEVALQRGEDPGFAMIANGSDPSKFFDALSASAVSASTGAPILLSTASVIPSATLMALDEVSPQNVYLIGGKASVPNLMLTVEADELVTRIWGPDRYSTSTAVAQAALDRGWLSIANVGVAAKVPDALVGGVSMGMQDGPLLVTSSSSLPAPTYSFIDKYDQMIGQVTVFGGPKSVTGAVTTSIDKALK